MILRILFIVTGAVALVIGAILVYAAATRPNVFRIERAITVNALPEKVFPLIDNLRNWKLWNEQAQGPDTKQSYDGPANGAGATAEWSGKGSTGAGSMLITKSLPPTKISVQVNWRRPFQTVNMNEFTLVPEGNSTRVIWTMHGPNLYIMKLMSVFTNMDRMMGEHFEAGLANLKKAAEQ